MNPRIDQFSEYLNQQLIEIEKFKFTLGEQLGHDPLEDYSMNEIALMWISLYAAEFRKQWHGSNNTGS
jgi:hypothetical protein